MKQINQARLCKRGGSGELSQPVLLKGLDWEAAARPSLPWSVCSTGSGWPGMYPPWSVARNPGLGWGVKEG